MPSGKTARRRDPASARTHATVTQGAFLWLMQRPLRHRRPRWRQRRLRLRAARGRARHERSSLIEKDKVGGTCLHRGCIPTKALLHAAEVADADPRERRRSASRRASRASTSPASTPTRTRSSPRLCKGLTGPDQGRKGITVVEGEGRLAGPNRGRRSATRRLRGPQRRAGHRLGARVAARPRDRRRAGHHQRARADARPGARVGGRPRRRRHRRRVRQRLDVVRRRGDDRRGAAAPAAARGGVQLQAAGAGLPPPRHQVRARRPVRRASRPPTPA